MICYDCALAIKAVMGGLVMGKRKFRRQSITWTLLMLGAWVACLLVPGSNSALAGPFEVCGEFWQQKDRRIEACTQFIQQNPQDKRKLSEAYYNRGDAKGRFTCELSVPDYTKAIEIDSRNVKAYDARAFCFWMNGRSDEAIADHTAALRVDPNDAMQYLGRGNAYMAKGDLDHAIADWTESLRLDPTDKCSCIHVKRGDAYRMKGEYNRAYDDFVWAIEHPDAISFNHALVGLAWVLLKSGQPTDGLVAAEASLKRTPNNSDALVVRGHIFEAMGRKEDAIADLRQALSGESESAKQAEIKEALTRLGASP
jgi:tetratricopeptide (TPR) repeat protein